MPRTRALIVAAGVTVLTACSSSGGGAPADTTSAPAGTAPVSSSASGETSSAAPTTAPSSTAGVGSGHGTSPCAESQLRAAVTPQDIPGLDRYVVRLVFTNTSATTCTLTGFPGAAIINDSGAQVQQAKRVIGGPVGGTVERSVGTLSVRPGASVFAYLEGQSTKQTGAAQAGCGGPKYPRILVTPPNTRTAIPFTIGWPQCHAFDVHPVREQ